VLLDDGRSYGRTSCIQLQQYDQHLLGIVYMCWVVIQCTLKENAVPVVVCYSRHPTRNNSGGLKAVRAAASRGHKKERNRDTTKPVNRG